MSASIDPYAIVRQIVKSAPELLAPDPEAAPAPPRVAPISRPVDVDERLAGEPLNDTGNARRLLARFGDRILWVREVGPHVWTGTHWDGEGGAEHAKRLGQDVSEAFDGEVAALERAGPRPGESEQAFARRLQRHRAFGITSGNAGRIAAMIDQAAPHQTVAPEALDADPLALNVENGTLRFRLVAAEGDRVAEIRLDPHAIADRLSKCAPVRYDPKASAPTFEAFLARVVPDEAVRGFLQAWCGYCLTGLTTEQKLVFLWGSGANGKSTFVDLIARMLAGYAASLRFESLSGDGQRRGDGATPDLARLPGVRFLRASEPEQGVKFKEAEVKAITGGEPLLVRHLHGRFFELRPVFKLVLSGNHKPDIRGLDEGIWRRVLLVPFAVVLPPEERDPTLGEKLWAERSGVLNWMIAGLLSYLERGLVIPDAVRAATAEYRDDNDPLGNFLRDCTEPDPGGDGVRARELYEAFKAWCRENAVREWSEAAFGRACPQKGLVRVDARVRRYLDIRLRPDAPQPREADDPAW